MATVDIIAGIGLAFFLVIVIAVLIVAWKWKKHIRMIKKEYQKEVKEDETKEEEEPEVEEFRDTTSRYKEVIERERVAKEELRSLRDEADAGSIKRQPGLQIPSYKESSKPKHSIRRTKRKSKKSKHTIELHKPTDL